MGKTDAALQRQANRLRFTDPALEARFLAADDERSLRQWRLATAIGAVAVAVIGLTYSGPQRWGDTVELFGRYVFVLPPLLAAFAFSFWTAQRPRLQAFGAVCAALAVTGHFAAQCFSAWTRHGLHPTLAASLFSIASQFLIVIAVATPFRTPALATALLSTTPLFYVVMLAAFPETLTIPGLHRVVLELTATHLIISLVLLAITWARERLQRLAFAQQEQLAAANAELARLNAEKNEFMAIAAHDLRAPLATIGGVAEHLARDPASPGTRAGLELIDSQSRRMLALVNDYLGAHAAESGTLPVRLARLDLGAAAHAAVARHAAAAADKKQTLTLEGADAAVAVTADPALLDQVIDNFLTNAVKFSPPGTTVRLAVQTAGDHPRARLAVIDQGPGLSPDEQAQLFRKFSRGDARPTGGEASHGLGLAVAKRLAEAMQGSVGCDSTPGAGAAFWVELPRVR
jgi:signal transduction histidine kinase